MVFEDRISAYPGRYTITDENGNVSYVVLGRADSPTVDGTPLNADTFNRMQEEYQVESEEYPGCFYRVLNDVEYWINPPMMDGVEYRTTKRFNNKVVYTKKLVVTGTFDESTHSIGRGVKNVSEIVDLKCMITNAEAKGYHALPYYAQDSSSGTVILRAVSECVFDTRLGYHTVWFHEVSSCQGYGGYFIIEYTKADDVG